MITIVTGAISGITASLLTIFFTPRLQHHFWKLQRREELRLGTINTLNKLTAEFITTYSREGSYKDPGEEFWQSLHAALANVKALFSGGAYDLVERMAAMLAPNLGPEYEKRGIYDFILARDAALRLLYQEIGILV